jgi:hypothetical protein
MVVLLTVAPTVVHANGELSFAVTLKNQGTTAVVVDATAFPFPSVVLEVRDAKGAPVPRSPPPVPPKQRDVRTVAAGDALQFTYNGGSLFGFDLDPGTYTVRFHATNAGVDLASPWTSFEVE